MEHKTERKTVSLDGLTVRQLRALRRRLASGLTDPQAVLRGTLLSQGRRCGKENCRCVDGELHGPYTYVSVPRPGGRPHKVYVPAGLLEVVSGKVAAAAGFEAALAEITAINAELLARRELD
jgi:uncharacterized protein DUF6788